jgi:hypothetical protein
MSAQIAQMRAQMAKTVEIRTFDFKSYKADIKADLADLGDIRADIRAQLDDLERDIDRTARVLIISFPHRAAELSHCLIKGDGLSLPPAPESEPMLEHHQPLPATGSRNKTRL